MLHLTSRDSFFAKDLFSGNSVSSVTNWSCQPVAEAKLINKTWLFAQISDSYISKPISLTIIERYLQFFDFAVSKKLLKAKFSLVPTIKNFIWNLCLAQVEKSLTDAKKNWSFFSRTKSYFVEEQIIQNNYKRNFDKNYY